MPAESCRFAHVTKSGLTALAPTTEQAAVAEQPPKTSPQRYTVVGQALSLVSG